MSTSTSNKTKHNILAIIATDNTFTEAIMPNGNKVWVGKCIFCNKKLCVSKHGVPDGNVTIEHILPRSRGGTDDLGNLALACANCNHEKGIRHDVNKANKQRAFEVIEKLKRKRMKRWRKNKDL
jgi:5-methylcytosine-specific restriction endonuclease McrA